MGATFPTKLRVMTAASFLLTTTALVLSTAAFAKTLTLTQDTEAVDREVDEKLSELYQLPHPHDGYIFLEQQIRQGEADTAATSLQQDINLIEQTYHRYHEDLVTPLTLLGDAYMESGEVGEALDTYARARHIARVSRGLFDSQQLAVVYREADAHRLRGDLQSASQREEYAYEVATKTYPASSEKILPPMYRLASFYLDTFNVLAARVMYDRALAIHIANQTDMTASAIPALRGIAQSYLTARFPPFYVGSSADARRIQPPAPGLSNISVEAQQLGFANYPAGERALRKIVEIHQTEPVNKDALAQALVNLGDWHLMFDKPQTAATFYRHVDEEILGERVAIEPVTPDVQESSAAQGVDQDVTTATPEAVSPQEADSSMPADDAEAPVAIASELRRSGRFQRPTMIYFPRPEDPRPPKNSRERSAADGLVKLAFDVGPSGKVRRLRTIESQPPKLMDFRVRRSMREAVFRPMLVDGSPVVANDQTFTYRYKYFPDVAPSDPTQTGDAPAPAATEQTNEAATSDSGDAAVPDATTADSPAVDSTDEAESNPGTE